MAEGETRPAGATVGSPGSQSYGAYPPILRPGRSLINPFDPSHVTIKITSNRRRWSHVFPKGRCFEITSRVTRKGFLRTLETHHKAHQSTISAVPQTAENNLSGPPGKIHPPCPNYQRWHTAPLLLWGNQRAGAQQFPPAHYTFYRADPPEGYRLCEDASSGDHAP
ncbi:GATOR complex protein depdc5 [Homalodisca vitripennis]|nr:GATOR complex protein depdc5 [Homalodisca vitripennis]